MLFFFKLGRDSVIFYQDFLCVLPGKFFFYLVDNILKHILSCYNIPGAVPICILSSLGACVLFPTCFIRKGKLEDGVAGAAGDRYNDTGR